MNERGLIPIFVIAIVAVALGLIAGAKLQEKAIRANEICHDVNHTEPLPVVPIQRGRGG